MAVSSVAFLVGGLQLGLGDGTTVGPGAFPVFVGALGLVAAALTIAEALLRKGDAVLETSLPDSHGLLRMAAFLAGLCAFAVLLERAGFVLASLVACTAASRAGGQGSTWRALGFAGGLSVVVYVVFTRLLAVPLPGLPVGS